MTPFASFAPPNPLDLLTDFRKKFVSLAERRSAELREQIDARRDEPPSPEMRDVYDEYESLRFFEQELNRVIRAFMDEATKPWRETYADAMVMAQSPCMRCGGRLIPGFDHKCPDSSKDGL